MKPLRRNRRHLAKPLPVISGKVILLEDFVVDPRRGSGFVYREIDAADLPGEAIYFWTHPQTHQIIYALPEVRSKQSLYNLTHSPTDPTYKFDDSYWWRDGASKAKENASC